MPHGPKRWLRRRENVLFVINGSIRNTSSQGTLSSLPANVFQTCFTYGNWNIKAEILYGRKCDNVNLEFDVISVLQILTGTLHTFLMLLIYYYWFMSWISSTSFRGNNVIKRILIINFTWVFAVSSIFPAMVSSLDHLPTTHTESSGENTEMQGAYSLRWLGDWYIQGVSGKKTQNFVFLSEFIYFSITVKVFSIDWCTRISFPVWH